MDSVTKKAALLISIAAFAVSIGSLSNPFVHRDTTNIVSNPNLRHMAVFSSEPAHLDPLVALTHSIVFEFAKLDPAPYRFVSIALHSLTGIALFLLLERLLWYLARERKVMAPLLAGLFFVLLPINQASAQYISAVGEIEATLFTLLAIYLYVREPTPKMEDLLGSLACTALGLLAHPMAILTPFLLVLCDIFFVCEGALPRVRARLKYVFGYVLLAILYLRLRHILWGAKGGPWHEGSLGDAWNYLTAQAIIVWKYLYLTLIPHGLAIRHDVSVSSYPWWARLVASGAIVALICVSAGLFRRRDSKSRLLGFGIALFLFASIPSFFMSAEAMAERRAYLANVSIVTMLVFAYDQLVGVAMLSSIWRRRALALASLHLLLMVGVSLHRSEVLRSSSSAWQDVLKKYPQSVMAMNAIAGAHLDDGRYADVQALTEQILKRDPENDETLTLLGFMYSRDDLPFFDQEKAIGFLERAIRRNPSATEAYYHLGRIYQQRARDGEAEAYYVKVLDVEPGYLLAHFNLGILYHAQGRTSEAKAHFERALYLDPDFAPGREMLQKVVAGTQGKQAMALHPDARPVDVNSLPTEMVVSLFEGALARDPENETIRRTYAELCLERKLPCAAKQYRLLAEAHPDDAELKRVLEGLKDAGP